MFGGMFARIQRFADRLGTWTTLWAVSGVGGILTLVSGWISSYSGWVSSFGAIGWVIAGLLGGVLFASFCLFVAWVRLAWIKGNAINKWKSQTVNVNPLDAVITHQRIDFASIVDPIGNIVTGKTFTSCDLIGPSVVVIMPNVHLLSNHFFDCDFIVLDAHEVIFNATRLADCTFNKCRFSRMTFYIHPALVGEITKMGTAVIGASRLITKA